MIVDSSTLRMIVDSSVLLMIVDSSRLRMIVESSVSRIIVESSTFRPTFTALGGVSIHDGMTRAGMVAAKRREERICIDDGRILYVLDRFEVVEETELRRGYENTLVEDRDQGECEGEL